MNSPTTNTTSYKQRDNRYDYNYSHGQEEHYQPQQNYHDYYQGNRRNLNQPHNQQNNQNYEQREYNEYWNQYPQKDTNYQR